MSMFAVASSINTILLFFKVLLKIIETIVKVDLTFKSALAIQINCFSPTLRFSPSSLIRVESPFFDCVNL